MEKERGGIKVDSGEKERALEYFAEKCTWCKDYNGIENDPPCNRVGNTCIDLMKIRKELTTDGVKEERR